MYFVYLFLCFLGGRILLLCSLYFFDSPYGGPFVENWTRFLPHSLVADIGIFALASLFFSIIRTPKAAGCFLAFYMFLMGADDECMRWMGSRFGISFASVYMRNLDTDFSLVGKIFMGGAGHFCLTIGIMIISVAAYICLLRKFGGKQISRLQKIVLPAVFAVLAVAGLSSKFWFAPSKMRWQRIQPVALYCIKEVEYGFTEMEKPNDYALGIEFLGGNPNKEYPFWHKANDLAAYQAFRELPEKPNVIIFNIETMRGWYSDIRDSATCANLPNLCGFSSRAVFFPEAHSVGYPSIEGLAGIQMGIYNHPKKVFMSSRKLLNTLSLPEILREAGYYNALFTASEPSFDNLWPHFRDWFDHAEYDRKNDNDVPLANRVAQWLEDAPKDKPLYLNYMSTTTHAPFKLPKNSGYATPENMTERYKLALHYADSAIGILLKAINLKYQNNIIIITGDHAYPENTNDDLQGSIHKGYTHIPLWISADNLPNSVDLRIVSQAAIAPTILDILELDVSNHFVCSSLLKNSNEPVFTFRNDNYFIYNSETDSIKATAAMEAWSYVLDKNLLMIGD
ncbi:MAG: sulfatase-like hydrolase/transferase [Candidatus Fibromonas sp.]|jgi:phosphoglycerol transferase MdoB-like AlkP superfamily enzyme|nr:sulfatase-like hydrolase/transferase [Candidatus Fibromonas sp.]